MAPDDAANMPGDEAPVEAGQSFDWTTAAPCDETKKQIDAAFVEVMPLHTDKTADGDASKAIVEEMIVALKDKDGRWIDFDPVPRTHGNLIYASMYQKVYHALRKQVQEKAVQQPTRQKKDRLAKEIKQIDTSA